MANDPILSISAFGAQIMSKQLEAILAEADGVLEHSDIECIHRMRVASRRLRAAQSLFDAYLPDEYVKKWEKQIKRVTSSLGAARDLDIQIETIRKFRLYGSAPQYQAGINRLLLRLIQKRNDAQIQVLKMVPGLQTSATIHAVSEELQSILAQNEEPFVATDTLRQLAARSISSRLDGLLSYEKYIDLPEQVEELHAMRIAAKWLRYTLEIFAVLDDGGLKTWLKPLREFQESLGLIHDCDVWGLYLPQFLQEERRLVGNSYSFHQLVPGINAFRKDRSAVRHRIYTRFCQEWRELSDTGLWQELNQKMADGFTNTPNLVIDSDSIPSEISSRANPDLDVGKQDD